MSQHSFTYDVPVPYSGKPEDVFDALINPQALEIWFAEHVDIEAKVGGAYRFWGKHTLGTSVSSEAKQVITEFNPPSTLAFTWTFKGQPSTVRWVLSPDDNPEKTRVRIEHHFEALPSGARAEHMIDDFWRLQTGSLCLYMMGRTDIFRPDFDDPNPVVRHVIEIDAAPEAVFKALTEPDYVKKWFPAPAPFIEREVGGKFGFGFSYEVDGKKVELPPMTILAYEENKQIAYTWPDWRGDESVPDQTVSWTLEDLGGRTKLTLEHSGFTRTVDVSDYPFGWIEFINQIKTVSEEI